MQDLETPRKVLAENLKSHREARGLTQKDFAAKLKISWRTIAQIEQQHRFATDEMLAKIANGLGTTVAALLSPGGVLQSEPAPAVAQFPHVPGQVPAQLLVLIARLANDVQAIETLIALSAKFLGIPVETTNHGHARQRRA